MVEFPAQQPAFLGEWTYNTATIAPPANAQVRMNNAQNKPTLIWVNNISFNGIDASAWLMEMVTGYVIRIQDKNDATLWQTYSIVGDPVAQSGYVELKTAWLAGGKPVVATNNIMVSVVSSVIRLAGTAATASVGSAIGKTSVRIPVTTPGLTAMTSDVTITGQLVTFDYYHAFQGQHWTSPGITIRQWYAGQALMGFIASKAPAAGLIGKVSEYAFKVADSMIAYEAKQAAGITSPAVPRPPSPAAAAPPQSAPATVTEAQVIALQKKDAEAA